mmetsp:Transcript_70544/g.187943  ORF Transcript_70544/g.187943 Transcript_70544/m.187943 type:complete len:317 (+) Transcript_70544:994-1944(+)
MLHKLDDAKSSLPDHLDGKQIFESQVAVLNPVALLQMLAQPSGPHNVQEHLLAQDPQQGILRGNCNSGCSRLIVEQSAIANVRGRLLRCDEDPIFRDSRRPFDHKRHRIAHLPLRHDHVPSLSIFDFKAARHYPQLIHVQMPEDEDLLNQTKSLVVGHLVSEGLGLDHTSHVLHGQPQHPCLGLLTNHGVNERSVRIHEILFAKVLMVPEGVRLAIDHGTQLPLLHKIQPLVLVLASRYHDLALVEPQSLALVAERLDHFEGNLCKSFRARQMGLQQILRQHRFQIRPEDPVDVLGQYLEATGVSEALHTGCSLLR